MGQQSVYELTPFTIIPSQFQTRNGSGETLKSKHATDPRRACKKNKLLLLKIKFNSVRVITFLLCCHHDDERADGQPLSVVNDASRKVAVRIAHSTRLRVLAKEGRGTNGKGV